MKKLSIIIPHFNSPDLLSILLDSIPTFEEIEILVVDDRSDKEKDKFETIKNSPKYNHVIFLENSRENKGAGTCRNIGLDNATGEWVLFADADDFFLEGFFEIVQEYFDSDYEVVFFTPTSKYLDTGGISERHIYYEKLILEYLTISEPVKELKLRYEYVVPWSRLINRNFIEKYNIRFDEVIVSNDVMFSVKVGYYMYIFAATTKCIYCVTRSKGTLTVNISGENYDTRIDVFVSYYVFLKNYLSKQERIKDKG